jgi:hypothetical protein
MNLQRYSKILAGLGTCLILLVLMGTSARAAAGDTTRVSVASDGMQGDSRTYKPSISANGRYVAFASDASNLVSGDTNGYSDIFVHDLQTGEKTRVSVASDGEQGNYQSLLPSILADGHYVTFSSNASNMVSGDANGYMDRLIYEPQKDSENILFKDEFNGDLSQWDLFGLSSPYIDTSFGNPVPSYENNGFGLNNGALSKMVFTPAPGMMFSIDIQISSFADNNGLDFGFSRNFVPTPSSWDMQHFLYITGPAHLIQVTDCAILPLYDFDFHHFIFIIRDDYKLDAYMGDPGSFVCTSSFTMSEFVNKPIIITGRSGHADNVIVQKTVQITSPNGQDKWDVGSTHTINWNTSTDLEPSAEVNIYYSTDKGSHWQWLTKTANVGSYDWMVHPDALSDQALIKVTVHQNGVDYSAISDAPFSVSSNSLRDDFPDSTGWYQVTPIGYLQSDVDNGRSVENLVFPGSTPQSTPTPSPGPENSLELIKMHGDDGLYQYGTYQARLKAGYAKPETGLSNDEGIVSSFFTYWSEGTDLNSDGIINGSEIDIELLGHDPHAIYVNIWTAMPKDNNNQTYPPSNYQVRIDMTTGERDYKETWKHADPKDDNTWKPYLSPLPSSDIIDTFDSTTEYYVYGFTWNPDSVQFFVYYGDKKIELLNYTDSSHIPFHPAKLLLNIWYTDHWHAYGFMDNFLLSPPRENSKLSVDWVDILEAPLPILMVNKTGTGSGTVMSLPTGINCGITCVYDFGYNSVVTLTAIPSAGSIFTGWGEACTGINSCQVMMTSSSSVTANFELLKTISGNTGINGVTLTYMVNGKLLTVISDAKGNYVLSVPYGWTGSVKPSKQYGGRKSFMRYYFIPAIRNYTNLTVNQKNQNFTLWKVY